MTPKEIQNIDLNNAEFQSALNLVTSTNRSVFLTGKAGTGKSTFLKYVCATTKKKHIVLAPTGIAAINVGGMTLHSFFKIPFRPLLPDDPDFNPLRIRKTLRYSRDKVKLIKELELIIIDEISMVRCDIIDFIDKVLRIYSGNMREPFGGKQLLFVGDIFQLEPVVTRDMKEILARYYPLKQYFFFNARVFNQLGLIPIELRRVYRQQNIDFIALLDRARVAHITRQDLFALNGKVNQSVNERDNETFSVTLATRRDTVDSINDAHMSALTTPEFTFLGEVEGVFDEHDLPTGKVLILKKGAQVIFIRNDAEGRWVNGSVGIVNELDEKHVEVALEDGSCHEVEPETWENIQYSYDEKEKKVVEQLRGTFKQLPIKPAWAITVHKSQGLTFNNVILDFTGGAFSSGQTYVALSRCTSLEGITLLHPLSERDFFVTPAITQFSHSFNDGALIDDALRQAQARSHYTTAVKMFEQGNYGEAVDHFVEGMKIHSVINEPYFKRYVTGKFRPIKKLHERISVLEQVIDSQNKLLRELALEFTAMGDNALDRGDLVSEPMEAYGKNKRPDLDAITIKSAMANYDKALRIYPQCIEAMNGKALMLVAVGEDKRAEDVLREALKLDGKNFDTLMALAALREQQNDIARAVKTYKRAIRAARKRPEPHDALAHIYSSVGLDDLAEEHQLTARKLRSKRKK